MSVRHFGILVGLSLIVLGTSVKRCKAGHQLAVYRFLRNDRWSLGLFTVASGWFLYKVSQLGEADFGNYKAWLLILFIFSFIGCGIFWKDFLGVRAIAMLTLMGVHMGLKMGYMSNAWVHPFLSAFLYGLILVALFFGVYPYRARDILPFLFKSDARLIKWMGNIAMGYGAGLILLACL